MREGGKEGTVMATAMATLLLMLPLNIAQRKILLDLSNSSPCQQAAAMRQNEREREGEREEEREGEGAEQQSEPNRTQANQTE